MTLSLLYPTEKSLSAALSPQVLAHLSLDRAIAALSADSRQYEYFMRVLSEFNADIRTIKYRQEILRDLREAPALLGELISLYDRFEELRTSASQTKRDSFRLGIDGTESLAATESLLQTSALSCKRALLFVKAFAELTAAAHLSSEGMKRFASECQRIASAEKFHRLIAYCVKYETPRTSKVYDFRAILDLRGRITSYRLIDHRYIRVTDPEAIKKRGFFKRAEKESHPCARLYPAKGDTYDALAASALSALAAVFTSVSAQIFERFSGIRRELDFYAAAIKYTHALENNDIPLCFPSFSSDGHTEVTELYDLYLAVTSKAPVPNDVYLEKRRGLLIFGENSSGKTTFLRSVGCMQVLFQAGLPIPAREAVLSPHTLIATQFSESEKSDTDSGRFEKEASELSLLLDALPEGAMVLLNETFQSTAYSEGAEALAAILEYLGDRGISILAVSHLRQLEALISPHALSAAVMSDGYKLIIKNI